MTLGDLINAYRDEADDRASTQLAVDERLIRLANEAQEEACSRARLILDSITPEVCELSFTAGGSSTLDLDPRVISIRRATWPGRATPLQRRLTQRMDEDYPGWEQHAAQQEPSLYITDVKTGAIRLYPTPLASGTVRLSVFRYPLDDMTALDDEPEIKPRYHLGLVQWLLFRVYSTQDVDAQDNAKANTAIALFERQFGEERSARNMAWLENEMVVAPDPLC